MDHHYHIPAKIFILGEYSVLSGHPALVAAVRLTEPEPYYGMGSSTARFIHEFGRELGSTDTLTLWRNYCFKNPNASGADLIAQSEALKNKGALFEIQIQGNGFTALAKPVPDLLKCIHVFSASSKISRKLNTDLHLSELSHRRLGLTDFPNSESYLKRFWAAQQPVDYSVLTDWANAFEKLNLETQAAKEDRDFIQSLPGVTGVKGCGAGLNDVFLVALDPQKFSYLPELIQKICSERQLQYLGTLKERLWNT